MKFGVEKTAMILAILYLIAAAASTVNTVQLKWAMSVGHSSMAFIVLVVQIGIVFLKALADYGSLFQPKITAVSLGRCSPLPFLVPPPRNLVTPQLPWVDFICSFRLRGWGDEGEITKQTEGFSPNKSCLGLTHHTIFTNTWGNFFKSCFLTRLDLENKERKSSFDDEK